ncbi:MAG: hypothetical protein QXU93_11275 [Thermoproteus sp.]
MRPLFKCLEDFAKMYAPGSLARSILEWQIKEIERKDVRGENP